ncbi:hypothetical protein PASE110613_08910 [Paenibacillus sediminis]|uniref:Uncharacterized protein n=1 Tax=Paenibacillus sediminis TaxID=664909 RepID=A0ABS4H6A1_9BACL|nr:hypothetical protein [Paenibacillus sediminis]
MLNYRYNQGVLEIEEVMNIVSSYAVIITLILCFNL